MSFQTKAQPTQPATGQTQKPPGPYANDPRNNRYMGGISGSTSGIPNGLLALMQYRGLL